MNKSDQVYAYALKKIKKLQAAADTGPGRAAFAELRRGVGTAPGAIPQLWGLLFDGLPEELAGFTEASGAEWAIHTALTLYAMHMGGAEREMQIDRVSIGAAAANLVHNEEDEPRIVNRMNLVVTAETPTDLAYRLRGIIQLLRNDSVGLDYARLAKELYLFRFDNASDRIKLTWGRDFYRQIYANKQ